jgi:hypothetical protein
MEVYSSSVEDQLIEGLSYKLSSGSSYITDRNSVTYFASGSNIYTNTSGTKVLRFLINGDGWLDPSTLKIFFDVQNLSVSAPLRVLGGPYTFFKRMRILCANQLVEDVDHYNRLHYMMDSLRSKHVRDNEDCEGFGDSRFDNPTFFDLLNNNSNNPLYTLPTGENMTLFESAFKSVLPGQSRTVSFKPLSGLLGCQKLIPLKWSPITIELELCPNATDPIISVAESGLGINTANTSLTWQIQNPQVKCDVVTLDSQLENEYASLLLSGKSLPINYSSFISQQQSISGPAPSINVTRALSRLKSVFVSFDNVGTPLSGGQNSHLDVYKKSWSDLFHPMAFTDQSMYDNRYEVEYSLQVGSHLFPSYPIRSLSEAFYQLRKCMGVHSSNFHSLDITPAQYRSHKFILGFDMEKNLGTAFTGLNVKNGSLISLKMRGTGTESSANTGNCMPDMVYVFMHADCILQINDSGVQIFE